MELLIEIREIFRHNLLFSLGIILICSFIFGKLAEKIKLPVITGYIIAGLILGETFIGLVPNVYKEQKIETKIENSLINEEELIIKEHRREEQKEKANPLGNITEIAIRIIAINIGGEFNLKKFKKSERSIIVITIMQLFLSFGLVSLFLWIFNFDIIFALLLGAIATATAPATTVAIIRELKAKGNFVKDYLYGLVINEIGTIISFGIILSIASSIILSAKGYSISIINIIVSSLMEVLFSALTGFISGYLLHKLLSIGQRKKITINEQLLISLSILFISTSIAVSLKLSSLLTNIVLGATLINLSERNEKVFKIIGNFAPPIYAIFFAIAGTKLNLSIFFNIEILIFGSIFVIARALGKYFGIFFGGILLKSIKDKIKNYLGFCMIPQAGVAIGLTLILQNSEIFMRNPEFTEYVNKVISIVLFSVCINELLGPSLSKYAIIKCADFSEDITNE